MEERCMQTEKMKHVSPFWLPGQQGSPPLSAHPSHTLKPVPKNHIWNLHDYPIKHLPGWKCVGWRRILS